MSGMRIPFMLGTAGQSYDLLKALRGDREFKMMAKDSTNRGLIDPLEFGGVDPEPSLNLTHDIVNSLPQDDTLGSPKKGLARFNDDVNASAMLMNVYDYIPLPSKGIRMYRNEDLNLDPRYGLLVARPAVDDATDPDNIYPSSIAKGKDFVNLVKRGAKEYERDHYEFQTPEEKHAAITASEQPPTTINVQLLEQAVQAAEQKKIGSSTPITARIKDVKRGAAILAKISAGESPSFDDVLNSAQLIERYGFNNP